MRTRLTIAVALFMVVLLGWQYVHGGVPAHHLLARDDLPAVSNWWGLLTLPVLAWFLLGRIERRREGGQGGTRSLAAGFVASLLYGFTLALCFVSGKPEVSDIMAQGVFVIALFYPVYRAECVLGFVVVGALRSPCHRLHRGTRRQHLQLLEAVYHHFLAFLQAIGDDPVGAFLRGDLDGARGRLVVRADHHHGVAGLAAAGHGLLRYQDARRQLGLGQAHAHVLARQQGAVRVCDLGAQGDLAAGRIDGHVREQQLAFAAQFATVVEDHRHRDRRVDAAVAGALAQALQFGGGLGDVQVDVVGLLDQRHLGRFGA